MLALSNIITVFFSIILLILYPYIKVFVKLDEKYIYLMIALFFLQPAYNFWFTRQRYELKSRQIFISSMVCTILSPSVAVISILIFPLHKLDARIFGAELPLIAVYTVFYIHILISSKRKINLMYWKEAFLFNIPLIVHYLSMYLLSSSDRIMISNLVNDSATAYYTVAYSVASVALILWNAVNSSLVPFTYEKCKIKQFSDINRITVPILFILGVASVFVIMLAPEVLTFMATKDYREAIYVIPPIVGGVFFQALYSVFANIIYYYKKPVFVTIGSVTAVILNLILNYFFIKKYGYIAAGYTTLVCYALQALIDYIGMRKVAGRSIYNMRILLTLSLMVVVISLISNVLYDSLIMRLVILISIIIGMYLYRKRIIDILRIIRKK